jgi:deoxyadenosine/deoxycytidine kinase
VPAPDAIIYLRTPAAECLRRLQIRGRAEEHNITLDYLTQLEISHDEWLMGPDALTMPVLVLDGMQPYTAEDVWQKLEQVKA